MPGVILSTFGSQPLRRRPPILIFAFMHWSNIMTHWWLMIFGAVLPYNPHSTLLTTGSFLYAWHFLDQKTSLDPKRILYQLSFVPGTKHTILKITCQPFLHNRTLLPTTVVLVNDKFF
jgi:hypothetical protein